MKQDKVLGYLETIETSHISGDLSAAVGIEEQSKIDNKGNSYESEHTALFSLFSLF